MKRILAVLLILMLFLLTGCRSRTTAPGANLRREGLLTEDGAGNGTGTGREGTGNGEKLTEDGKTGDGIDAVTVENSESGFRTYDENASAEVIPGANHRLQSPG